MKKGRRSGPFSFARLAGRRLKGASINTNPQVRNRDLLPFILACLAMIGPFSIDTYLPAFPAMVASLGATQLEVQQTLTAYLLPFAVAMLWQGALSDTLGRRRVILWGLAIYVAASIFCIAATNIQMLWIGRALQGLSAGVGMVVGRAMIRDLYDGAAAQKLMAKVGIIFALAPALAPIFGGWIHAFFDWHAIFVFLALFGGALWCLVWFLMPETLDAAKRQPLSPANLWAGYRSVFGNAAFMRLSVALAFVFNGMFVYVLSAPVFLMTHLDLSAQDFAWLFVPMVAGLMAGSVISGRLAGKRTPQQCIRLGFVLTTAAAALNVALNLNGSPGLPWAVLALPLFTCGLGIIMPGLQLLALDLFPERRGMASSCQGTVHTGINALVAGVLVPVFWSSTLTLAAGMAVFLLLAITVYVSGQLRS
jgi:MFS transporter, DHA1 family, multidrug resistance protein